ncbi:MAG: CAP domain-containing protein [Microscillaceae bacterium]|jgi:uncharacterized protein YkwD|nr:CAP domain-containing protein [Microscillaceae bacterium]
MKLYTLSYLLKIGLFFVFCWVSTTVFAQPPQKTPGKKTNPVKATLTTESTWKRENYKTVNHQNFRDNALFKKNIDSKNPDYTLLNACIFFAVNEQRVKAKLKPLDYAQELEIAAWHHAKRMAEKDFFSHENNADKNRKNPDDRAKLAGISNPYIAENIAMRSGFGNQTTYLALTDDFINQWMNSTGHKENILHAKALQLGCGVFMKDQSWYGVQCFQWFKPIVAQKATDKLP